MAHRHHHDPPHSDDIGEDDDDFRGGSTRPTVYDGRRLRINKGSIERKTRDYSASVVNYISTRPWLTWRNNPQRCRPSDDSKQPLLKQTTPTMTTSTTTIPTSSVRNARVRRPTTILALAAGVVPQPMFTLADEEDPRHGILDEYVHTIMNKVKSPVQCVAWSPGGRRLVTGSSSGEFTLWNGMQFNFETILQAHDSPVLAMNWAPDNEWMLSGDQGGVIKYWEPSMNALAAFKGHTEAINDACFQPCFQTSTDFKFATCSDDKTIHVWNAERKCQEATFTHAWNVRTISWHPTSSLLLSGSKDLTVKLWDVRTKQCLRTFHHLHTDTVNRVRWSPLGNTHLFATASRDHLAKVWDLRQIRDDAVDDKDEVNQQQATCVGTTNESSSSSASSSSKEKPSIASLFHESEVSAMEWHPVIPSLLVTGCFNGQVSFWPLLSDDHGSLHQWELKMEKKKTSLAEAVVEQGPPVVVVGNNDALFPATDLASSTTTSTTTAAFTATTMTGHAHDLRVNALAFHPFGHILATGSTDSTVRFWGRRCSSSLEASAAMTMTTSTVSSRKEETVRVPGFGNSAEAAIRLTHDAHMQLYKSSGFDPRSPSSMATMTTTTKEATRRANNDGSSDDDDDDDNDARHRRRPQNGLCNKRGYNDRIATNTCEQRTLGTQRDRRPFARRQEDEHRRGDRNDRGDHRAHRDDDDDDATNKTKRKKKRKSWGFVDL